MSNKNSRLEAVVKGRVQGIGYRLFVKSKAESLGLKGYAKNNADGSVEVIAEGPVEKLENLLNELKKGPFLARVDEIKSVLKKPVGEKGFQIK